MVTEMARANGSGEKSFESYFSDMNLVDMYKNSNLATQSTDNGVMKTLNSFLKDKIDKGDLPPYSFTSPAPNYKRSAVYLTLMVVMLLIVIAGFFLVSALYIYGNNKSNVNSNWKYFSLALGVGSVVVAIIIVIMMIVYTVTRIERKPILKFKLNSYTPGVDPNLGLVSFMFYVIVGCLILVVVGSILVSVYTYRYFEGPGIDKYIHTVIMVLMGIMGLVAVGLVILLCVYFFKRKATVKHRNTLSSSEWFFNLCTVMLANSSFLNTLKDSNNVKTLINRNERKDPLGITKWYSEYKSSGLEYSVWLDEYPSDSINIIKQKKVEN